MIVIIIINVIKTVVYYLWYFYLCLWAFEGLISLGGTSVITVNHILDFVLILMLKKEKAQTMLEQITFP